MDFQDWKKISEDGKTCTLLHPKGHKMTISLGSVSKIQREQLKRLKLADGGMVKKYADGTPDGTVSSDDQSQQPAVGNHTPITINVGVPNQSPTAALLAPSPKPILPAPVQNMAAAPVAPKVPQSQVSNNNLMLQDQTLNAPAAVGLQQKAIEQQAPIDIEKAKQAEQIEKAYIPDRESVAQMDLQHYGELKQHTDEFADYMNKNPINPRAYQENMGTGQKIATGIGLFLGGLGTPFGGHNYAQDFLNKQIDRDIEAQKSRADQQKTVWGAYKDLYGDSNIATNLTKVSLNDLLTHRATLAAAQLGTPQAIQKANELKAQKAIENNQLLLESSGRLGTLRTGGGMPKAQSAAPGAGGAKGAANGKQPQEDWFEDHILAPNANSMAQGLQYNVNAKPNFANIMEQKARADLSDKALQTIKEAFPRMRNSPSADSISGYIHRKGFPGINHIPVIGPAAREITDFQTDTPDNRSYDSDLSSVRGAIRGALQGNVSDDLLDQTLNANIPESGDTAAVLEKKMRTLKEFIKSHTKTDLLRQYGLSKQ